MVPVDCQIPGFVFLDPGMEIEWQNNVFPNADAISADKVWRDKEVIEEFDRGLASAHDVIDVEALAAANDIPITEDEDAPELLTRSAIENLIDEALVARSYLPDEEVHGQQWSDYSAQIADYKVLLNTGENLFSVEDGVIKPIPLFEAKKLYWSAKAELVREFCQRYIPNR